MKTNILCITPIKHLDGVMKELIKYGTVTYRPNISKRNLIILLSKKKHNSLFVNQNKQGYRLDREVLKNSNISLINTCSTGTNHIDIKYCKKNSIFLQST